MTFVEKANLKHNFKYSYEKIKYINNHTKVEIICPIHGSFFQQPSNHTNGKGCRECSKEKVRKNRQMTKEEFIKKSKEIHDDKFNYDKVIYVNNRTKVTIICPIHGEFNQSPGNHFKYDCLKCGQTQTIKKQTRTQEKFLDKANKIHGKKYDYSQVIYNGAHQKIKIICNKHGIFEQTANSHLVGRGCPECKQGEGHPFYGKVTQPTSGYYGEFKGNIFRSLSELFWMIEANEKGINYIGLDQIGRRKTWQVEVNCTGRAGTYCADFYVIDTNEIIDIKPVWRQEIEKEKEKLRQGKEAYEKRGYNFKLIDTKQIKIKERQFKTMVQSGEVKLIGKAIAKYEKRFG